MKKIKCNWCKKGAEYHYHNKVSGSSGDYCFDCLGKLRNDVTAREWIKFGMAKPINRSKVMVMMDREVFEKLKIEFDLKEVV